jgi:hypothetical protein
VARGFAWTWLATVMAFFSATPARLEQYSLPALPAVALLAACGIERLWTGRAGPHAWRWLAVVTVLITMGGVSLLGWADRLIESAYWLDRASPFTALVTPAGAGLTGLGVVLGAAAWRRHAPAFVTALGAGSVALIPIIVRAHVLAEPRLSWKPVAQAIEERLPEGIEVAFEAKEEYQLVGGLAYYLGRHVTLLELPGFVPPTYLESHFRSMFLPARAFPRAVARRPAGGPGQRSRAASGHVRRHRPGAVSRRRAVRRPVAAVECRAVGVRRTAAACGSDRRRCVITDGRLVAGSHARRSRWTR